MLILKALGVVVYLSVFVVYLTYPARIILVFIAWCQIVLTGLVSNMYCSLRDNGFRPGLDVQQNRGEVSMQGLC